MTLKSTQSIGSTSYIHDPSLAVIHQSVLEITWSRAIFAYIMSPMTFDLMTPKYYQFICSARFIHDPRLAGIHWSVLEIMRSRAIFAYKMSPVTFDLVTPKSNHFICSARFIHDPSLGRNPSISSWDYAITSYFCIHNEPFDLWPRDSKNLINSLALQDTYMTQV